MKTLQTAIRTVCNRIAPGCVLQIWNNLHRPTQACVRNRTYKVILDYSVNRIKVQEALAEAFPHCKVYLPGNGKKWGPSSRHAVFVYENTASTPLSRLEAALRAFHEIGRDAIEELGERAIALHTTSGGETMACRAMIALGYVADAIGAADEGDLI